MNEKLLDNYDKMVVKDKVAVIHCAFGDTPHTVAFVHVDKGLLETQKCDKAFMFKGENQLKSHRNVHKKERKSTNVNHACKHSHRRVL